MTMTFKTTEEVTVLFFYHLIIFLASARKVLSMKNVVTIEKYFVANVLLILSLLYQILRHLP